MASMLTLCLFPLFSLTCFTFTSLFSTDSVPLSNIIKNQTVLSTKSVFFQLEVGSQALLISLSCFLFHFHPHLNFSYTFSSDMKQQKCC